MSNHDSSFTELEVSIQEALHGLSPLTPGESEAGLVAPDEVISKANIPDKMYFRIGEVARIVGVKPYVLRYWETEFAVLAPSKSGSGQRVYRRIDVERVLLIKHLLYEKRYSIEGARRRLREMRKAPKTAEVAATPVAESTETVAEVLAEATGTLKPGMDPMMREKIIQLALELSLLANKPIRQIFKLLDADV